MRLHRIGHDLATEQQQYGKCAFPPGSCDTGALPKLLLLPLCFVPNGACIQLPPGLHACFLRNLTLPMYCLSLVFISCYLICDSEPTKNSFLFRCPPHAISSWKKVIFCIIEKASHLLDCSQHWKEM